MAEVVDVQAETIGVGSVIAFALYGYGIFISETIFGLEATALAMWVFAGTFAAVALLHGAYGRRPFALAHGGAAVGLAIFLLATDGLQALLGLLVLMGSGAAIAVMTIRARNARESTAT
ncbi:hypothetical protein [Natronolimnobius baerhuensis]|uniref:Uncharacterized protein n=1 Tax=Natronolimnobius baerhuensis TaxID=253108 RepID=A0A202E6P3_9EURY|nr:hypothetical protein [Natronolimnobius baerhuensis]OVE83935.1 hypothetical protein B2G88_16115 [Natronolimnobius baerhuensis]